MFRQVPALRAIPSMQEPSSVVRSAQISMLVGRVGYAYRWRESSFSQSWGGSMRGCGIELVEVLGVALVTCLVTVDAGELFLGSLVEAPTALLVGALKAMVMKLTSSNTVDLMIVYELPNAELENIFEGSLELEL